MQDAVCVHCGEPIEGDQGYELFVAADDDSVDEYFHEKCAIAAGVSEDLEGTDG